MNVVVQTVVAGEKLSDCVLPATRSPLEGEADVVITQPELIALAFT